MPINSKNKPTFIPQHETFGVFVTVHSKDGVLHGCMGRMSQSVISSNTIKNKVVSAMYDAVYKDARGNQRLPDGARVDVSYMLTPCAKIDINGRLPNGEEFDNRTMGCIAKNESNNMTTYLPRVLEGTDWLEFATSLAQKARSPMNRCDFYAYDTFIVSNYQFPILLMPHPGREYGKLARQASFDTVPNPNAVKKIIYISADHGKKDKHDHSYSWVKKELTEAFPKARHTVIKGIINENHLSTQAKRIENYMNTNTGVLLIGTTDLTHSGDRFGNKQLSRSEIVAVERSFIESILQVDPIKVKRLWNTDKDLACGFGSLYIMLLVAKNMGYKGEAIAYYDSQKINTSRETVSYFAASFNFPEPNLLMVSDEPVQGPMKESGVGDIDGDRLKDGEDPNPRIPDPV